LWESFCLDLIGIQAEGRLVFINTAGAKLLGAITPEQLIGKSLLDFVHPDDRDIVSDRFSRMAQAGTEVSPDQEKWIRLDGAVIDVEVAAMPLIYQDKPAVQFIARDVTRRKRAE
jgi:PAS domain S-box-containing protein